MNTVLSLVIPRFSFHSWNGLTRSLRNSAQFVFNSRVDGAARLRGLSHLPESFCRAICDPVSARWHAEGVSFARRESAPARHWPALLPPVRAQFDLNCAAVFAHDTIGLGIRNDVNAQNCHSADHIRAEVNSLDGFWHRMR